MKAQPFREDLIGVVNMRILNSQCLPIFHDHLLNHRRIHHSAILCEAVENLLKIVLDISANSLYIDPSLERPFLLLCVDVMRELFFLEVIWLLVYDLSLFSLSSHFFVLDQVFNFDLLAHQLLPFCHLLFGLSPGLRIQIKLL